MLGREVGGKQNILVLNDEAHHAYRIVQAAPEDEVAEDAEALDEERSRSSSQEATVWVDGLDRIHRAPGDQLLRRPLGDAFLSRARGRRHEPDLPVGRERLRADGRDRVGAGQDPAARRRPIPAERSGPPTSTSGAGSWPADREGARRAAREPEAGGGAQARRHPDRLLGRLRDDMRQEWATAGRPAAAGLHPRLQEHEAREGRLRVAGGRRRPTAFRPPKIAELRNATAV